MNIITKRIHIKGLVQGVGFRPFIYVLAHRFKLNGWVENRNDGVIIEIEGEKDIINDFITAISDEAPIASNIFSIEIEDCGIKNFENFRIVKSENKSDSVTEISPDIAVCEKCKADLKSQPHRIDYPFINCTNCGPRFSIIKDLPYDRDKTTMLPFEMCTICKKEYTDIFDRRFHAQPVACNSCGPVYELRIGGLAESEGRRAEGNGRRAKGEEQRAESEELKAESGVLRAESGERSVEGLRHVEIGKSDNLMINDFNEVLSEICSLLEDGKIVAMKGMGGFHLACDASKESVVRELRSKKIREGKPFAVMFSNIETLKDYAEVNETEEELLTSWQAPIVLLKMKKKLAQSVSNGMHTIGVMLPYMPFHYLLFEKLNLPAIVLTSGNLSDEPIILDNDMAQMELGNISHAVLTYNRDIYNRTDDSVAFVTNRKPRLIRRSRGYAPSPVYLNQNVEGIFAAGAELVNCFGIGKGNQALLSQHIGDLKNLETLEFYEETFHQFKKLFRFEPQLIARDLHPDYLSSKFADSLDAPKILIQHHHAHIASGMAEHGLDEPVIGVSFDGTGLGDDGNIWGSEFFVCDLNEYERINHFEYIPMPGGDKVTHETWRMGVSYLYHTYGKEFLDFDLDFLKNIDRNNLNLLLMAIDKKINAPLTSSSGRLFDAVSALINLCPVSQFHAEAPMRLESIINSDTSDTYNFDIAKTISFKKTIKEIIKDVQSGVDQSIISVKFHNTMVSTIYESVVKIQKEFKINKVVLSGGTFQNRYLLEKIENLLSKNGFEVYSQCKIPGNDGGIALGQLAIAGKRRG